MFFVESREELPVCPVCAGTLKYRDCKKRILKRDGGERSWLMIRRFKCGSCRRYHNELPDCLTPYKHYSSEIISGVLDEIVTPMDLDTEDYPCLQTMIRWIKWFNRNLANIEGQLRQIGSHLLNLGEELLFSTNSLLDTIRSSRPKWLEIILRVIYNSGGKLSALPW
ncbi:MAG: DUF6431 domain-containing protein [Eubacteriales bacterium]|nr:DUF6431 domain-containing protein [Eubacteriales bacterium]